MTTSAEQLRDMAADCRTRARVASPERAKQLRACARTFIQQALRLELFDHGKQVGRANVTRGSFREHLRAQRA